MTKFDVVSIGEVNPDLILHGIKAAGPVTGTEQEMDGYRLMLGGSTALATVMMTRLGLRTALVAKVGDDDYGRFCRAELAREGVDCETVVTEASLPTGVTVSLAYPQDRLLVTCYGTIAALRPNDLPWDVIAEARHVHVGGYFMQRGLRADVHTIFARARQMRITTSLDAGWDPDELWLNDDLRAALAVTDVFFPNETELAHIAGTEDVSEGLHVVRALGANEVVVKRGAAGASYLGPEGEISMPAKRIAPVDTTGAGDAFNAGYMTARLEGQPVAARLALGNASGASAALAVGGTGGVRSRCEVEALSRSVEPGQTPYDLSGT